MLAPVCISRLARLFGCTAILLSLLFLGVCASTSASVVYVNKNTAGTVHDGKSWGTAYLSVQSGVNAAASGDKVWVAAGTYTENVSITTSISLFGGFAGSEAHLSERAPASEATTIDGNRNGSGVAIIAPSVIVDGFTIRNCLGFGVPYPNNYITNGSGVFCAGDDSIVSGNTITGNSSYVRDAFDSNAAYGNGGGIACSANNVLITGNVITGNTSMGWISSWVTPLYRFQGAAGAGIFICGNKVTVDGNRIEGNSMSFVAPTGGTRGIDDQCTFSGAGVADEGVGTVIRRNVIKANSATAIDWSAPGSHGSSPSGVTAGGGIFSRSALISDNLIISNSSTCNAADQCGGGVWVSKACTLINNTIVDNASRSKAGTALPGGAISLSAGAIIVLRNNVIAFNAGSMTLTASVSSHNDIFDEGYSPGATDIASDPLFVDRADHDYHLKAGSPCIDAGDDSVVTPGETDLDANPRIRGAHVDIGAYELLPTVSVNVGASIVAPPTAVDSVVYVSGENGRLYAFTSPALSPVAGFPVDISGAVGTPVMLNTRPAVYYGKNGKAIYLTTNLGHVVKVWPDGKVAWFTKPLNGPTMSTPAVTPDGGVYVDLGLGTTSVASFLFKLDEANGVANYISPYLGSSPANALIDRSAAIDQHYAYVNASGDVLGSLAVLNQDNLTVRASFAPGEDALAPFLNGRNTYVATKTGSVYKVNGITMSPDLAFGTLGRVKVGEAVTAGPFPDPTGSVYVGTESGKVWKLDGATGTKSLFLDSGTSSAITGLLVTRTVVVFGTANGTLQQVPLGNPSGKSVETLSGPPAGGPVYDPVQNRFIIATTSGQVYSVPGM